MPKQLDGKAQPYRIVRRPSRMWVRVVFVFRDRFSVTLSRRNLLTHELLGYAASQRLWDEGGAGGTNWPVTSKISC